MSVLVWYRHTNPLGVSTIVTKLYTPLHFTFKTRIHPSHQCLSFLGLHHDFSDIHHALAHYIFYSNVFRDSDIG